MSTPAQRAHHRRQREGTRLEILAAADRLLRERPYRELTIDIVMAQTDLSRTAFYRHFDDVTDLVLQLLGDLGAELATVAERWGATAGAGASAPAHAGLTEIVDFFIRHGPLVRAVAEAAVTDELIERGYHSSLETLIEITAAALQRLVDSGRLEVPDPRALARALNLMNQAYLLDQFGREPFGDREVALATLELVWLGVAGSS